MSRVVFSVYLAALLCAASGCGQGDYIISGRSHDPCLEEIPACPRTNFAECILDPRRYTKREFPGVFNFVANVDKGADLEVVMIFAEQRDAGLITQITWNEPGCSDSYTYDSEGANLFEEGRDSAVFQRRQTVAESGEHLIEIETDMQALVLITVNVFDPNFQ